MLPLRLMLRIRLLPVGVLSSLVHAGSMRSRDTLLAAQGWQVLALPFYETSALVKPKAKQTYLRSKLPEGVLADMRQ